MISSFVGVNTGRILDCSAVRQIRKKKEIHFCGRNLGQVDRSSNLVELQHIVKESVKKEDADFIEIETPEQLQEICKRVNAGEDTYIKGKYRLCRDIDLKKQSWEPMGMNELYPFGGIFDGNGYKITNVRIKTKKKNCGFFGYLKRAEIRNLHIEGTANGGIHSGLMAGVNDESTISHSTVKGIVKGKNCIAGFVGKNDGTIEFCNSACTTKVKSVVPAVVASSAAVAGIGLMVVAYFVGKNPYERKNFYPPIPIDEEAVQVEDVNPAKGENSITCAFTTFAVAKKGKVDIEFTNPGNSNHYIIAQVQITESELQSARGKEKMSNTKNKLVSSETNTQDSERIIVAESGTIPPGYSVKTIPLQKLPDGTTLKPGKYKAIMYLTFYDVFTNQLASLNSQTPIILKVEE